MNATQQVIHLINEAAKLNSTVASSISFLNVTATILAGLVAISSIGSGIFAIILTWRRNKNIQRDFNENFSQMLNKLLEDETKAQQLVEAIFENDYIQDKMNDLIEGQVSIRLDKETDEDIDQLSSELETLISSDKKGGSYDA